jgi:hypothetical protein
LEEGFKEYLGTNKYFKLDYDKVIKNSKDGESLKNPGFKTSFYALKEHQDKNLLED